MKTIRLYINSKGDVNHLLIEETDYKTYLNLISESIKMIDDNLSMIDNENERQALIELKESYNKTINGEQKPHNWTMEPGVKYLSHCVQIASSPVFKMSKERKYRNEVTKYKDIWRRTKLPIRTYLGSIKLSPDKFDCITEGRDSSIDWIYV